MKTLHIEKLSDLSTKEMIAKSIIYKEGIEELSGIKLFRNKQIRFLSVKVRHEGKSHKVASPNPYGRKYIFLIRYDSSVDPVALSASDIPEAIGKAVIASQNDCLAKEFNPVIVKQIQVN